MAVAGAQVGVTELTGKNDGKEVEAYLRSVGLARGNPYCAAIVYWIGQEAARGTERKPPYPKTGWSPSMVSSPTWKRGKGRDPQPADTFGIYFHSKKRVAHTGLIEQIDGDYLITIEGNTSSRAAIGSASDREGEGVRRKRRPIRTIYSVRNWFD